MTQTYLDETVAIMDAVPRVHAIIFPYKPSLFFNSFGCTIVYRPDKFVAAGKIAISTPTKS